VDFELKPLPYALTALEPHLGAETLHLHREKHHAGYLKELELLIRRTPQADEPLETIIANATGHLFEAAAQVWNHDFLWRSMKPRGGGNPHGPLAEALVRSFGDPDGFRDMFRMEAAEHFGSGWIWLVVDRGHLRVVATDNAQLPLTRGQTPLVTLDLWEHAYYLDYRNERKRYVEAFLAHLIDWDFVAANFEAETPRARALSHDSHAFEARGT
jgi:superoxide dismutase, Fe-Mn family